MPDNICQLIASMYSLDKNLRPAPVKIIKSLENTQKTKENKAKKIGFFQRLFGKKSNH